MAEFVPEAEADSWLAPDGVKITTPHYAFARAYAAAKLGKLEAARAHLFEISRGGEEAAEHYADQLSRSQLRTNSLVGLGRASSKIGDETTARETYGLLSKIWHDADHDLPMLIEIAEFGGW